MLALGRPWKPAYRAPVRPASGLLAVPVAIGGKAGTAGVAALDVELAGFCLALLAAPLTRCIVLPSLMLCVDKVSSFLSTRPE